MRLSIRLTLSMLGLVVATAAITPWLADHGLVAAFLPVELDRLETNAHTAMRVLDEKVEDTRRALSGFTRAVAIEGMMRAHDSGGRSAADGLSEAEWRRRLGARLAAELAAHPHYLAFRLIGTADHGRELLRVDREGPGGAVRVAPDSELETVSDLEHVRRVLLAPPGRFVVSRVDLSRRSGRVRVPHVPVLRVLTPLFTPSGTRYGALGITLSLARLVEDIPDPGFRGTRTFLVDGQGDFILHPDSAKTFGHLTGSAYRLADEFPALARPAAEAAQHPALMRDGKGREFGVAVAGASLGVDDHLTLVQAVPREELFAPMREVRRASLLAALLVGALAILLALYVARRITQPLDRMTLAVRQLGSDLPLGVRPEGAGELRGLAEAMEAMQRELRRKSAELREGEQRLRLALDASHTGVWEWNLASDDVWWSEQIPRVVGGALQPTMRALAELVHPGDSSRIAAALGRVRQEGLGFREEFRVLTAGGHVRWLAAEGTARLDADGRPARVVGTVRDVTDRREVLEALRASEERFREMAESIDDVFWMTDPGKSRVLYVSPAYERIWGRRREELYDDPFAWIAAIHEDDRGSLEPSVRALQLAGDYDVQYRIVRPDGEVRWIHDRSYPVRDADGVVLRLVGVAEDVTRHRELEESFLQAQKLESIGRLAGGVAHDFNNILMVVQGHLELLRTGGEAERAESLEQMRHAVTRATALTRQLLAFSRRQALQPRRLDPAALVRDMTRFLRRLLGEDIALELDIAPDVPPVLADEGMLEQVLMNLAVNARDAMPHGGRLVIRLAHEPMDSGWRRRNAGAGAGPLVCLSVTDNGTGMDADTLAHAFEPFFTTKGVGKGTGLGLATVYGIVQQHHGWVGVESEPGRGTTVRVWLSPSNVEPGDAPGAPQQPEPRRGHETILLVEDEPALRSLLTRVLEGRGYRVLSAPTGREALDTWQARRADVDLVLTDVVMPDGVSGLDLLERVHADRPGMPTLCMSGYPAGTGPDAPEPVDAVHYLRKPFATAELLAAIQRLLDPHPAG